MALSAEQQQWVRDTGRESFHWDRIPEAYRNISGIQEWANDPDIDPNQRVQDYYSSLRASNPGRADQGDAELSQQASQSPRDGALRQLSQTYSSGGAFGGYGQRGPEWGGSSVWNPAGSVSPTTQAGRDILMQQLAAMGQAPTVDDPGIRENLAGQRIALQRGAERQKAAAAEGRYAGGMTDSGQAVTQNLGIEQARGEAEAQGVGQVLGGELDARRRQLGLYLNLALQSGDAESARMIQQQLAELQNQQYYAGLNQNQGQFEDSLGYNYNQLNQNANLQALLAILNGANF